jgi:putative phosphoribosyl transferase
MRERAEMRHAVRTKTIQACCRGPQTFADRVQAGTELAGELALRRHPVEVVLGIPRGGLIVAREIARRLKAELDVALAHKIGAPGNAELAIGAVDEDGNAILDNAAIAALGLRPDHVEIETERARAEVRRRALLYRPVRPRVQIHDRVVVVTDDGVATGATMRAALSVVRREQPRELIAALPVGPEDALDELAKDCDDVVCLQIPCCFEAVGQFYVNFRQTSDRDVLGLLREPVANGRA